MKRLAESGVGTRPFFYPMHQQPVLRRMGLFNDMNLLVSERLYRQGFYIPSGVALTNKQIEQVAGAVKSILS